MNLMILLLSLFIERFAPSVDDTREYRWLQAIVEFSARRSRLFCFGGGVLGLLLILALPLVVVAFLQAKLAGWNLLLYLIFAVAVLVYSFGPANLERQLKRYVDARDQGDTQAAFRYAQPIIAGNYRGDDGLVGMQRAVLDAVLVEHNERILGVIFWFVVLGPVGALLFRLSSVLRDSLAQQGEKLASVAESARVLHGLLAWLPARLTALAYALGGSFVDVVESWRAHLASSAHDWIAGNRRLLIETGISALQLRGNDEELRINEPSDWHAHIDAAHRLSVRSIVIWLVVVALLTLAGWAS